HHPVGAFDHAAAGGDRAARETLDAEQVQADGGAGDVGDAVEAADFVKVHLVQRHAVGRGLGFGEPPKDLQRQSTLSLAELAAIEDRFNVGKETVRVFLG